MHSSSMLIYIRSRTGNSGEAAGCVGMLGINDAGLVTSLLIQK